MNWYVINGEDHLGPFSEDVLRQLYEANDIEDSTLVWQEGMDNPVEYQILFKAKDEILEQSNLESESDEESDLPSNPSPDLPPDLPPLPIDEENKEESKKETKKEGLGEVKKVEAIDPSDFLERDRKQSEVDSDLAEIRKEQDNVLRANFGKPEEENKGVIIIEDEVEYTDESRGPFSLNFVKTLRNFILVSIILFAGSYAYMYYKNYSGSFDRPSKMSITDFQKLQNIAKNTNRENQFAFSISEDKTKIWLVTNNPYVGRVVLKMKSLTGKVLSSKDIELSSISMLRGKIAEFDQFEFQNGQNVVDGYYEIEVLTPTKLEIPFIAKFFPEKKRQFRFIDQVLISNMKDSEFDRELNSFNNSRAQNDVVFWEELSQKYRTLKAITTQIRDSLKNIFDLNRNNWLENVKAFEQSYMNRYGSYFTNFVVDNEQAYEKYKRQDFTNKTEVISHYVRLSRIAREVGNISMNAMGNLKRFKDIDDKDKMQSLERLVTTPFNRIIQDCDEKINFIQTK